MQDSGQTCNELPSGLKGGKLIHYLKIQIFFGTYSISKHKCGGKWKEDYILSIAFTR